MTSDRAEPEGLSAWAVRKEAEARESELSVSFTQWKSYLKWGLIQERPDGRWSPETVDRVIEVAKLGLEVRSLPRRVLLLRRDYRAFPMPLEAVRRAMLAVVPKIKRPMRKMRRVRAAYEWWVRQQGGEATPGQFRAPRFGLRLSQWARALQDADLELFETQVHGSYYLALAVLPLYLPGTGYDLADIPFEEQIVMLTVGNLELVKRR